MQTLDRDELTTYINAPPEAVYAVVSDVTRTPEYSPEVAECAWLDGATGPKLGARFKARNKVEQEGSGTRVTESYEVVRPITRIGWWIIESGSKENKNRRAIMHAGIAQSLQRLKALVEGQPR